jgi:F-type H+-transporting ATPase subunit delta
MSLRTAANRYAKALFDVALEEKADLAKIEQNLTEAAEVFVANKDLRHVAIAANLPEANRKALVETIADRLDATPQVRKLMVMLGRGRNLNLLPDLADAFRERLLAHQNIVRADVTSAVALSPEKTKALEESLAKVTGKKVELSVSVDPALLGGVVATIGSTVYDGSVKTQLQRMRQELVEQ